MKACFRAGQNNKGLTLFDRMRSYPPSPPRDGGHSSSSTDLEKASPATKTRKAGKPFPKYQVLFPQGREEEEEVGDSGTSSAAFAAALGRIDGPVAREGSSKGGTQTALEGVDTPPTPTAGAGAGVAARGRGKGRAGRAFRASSPPRPDTVSYNTVIAAVASAWGGEGRGQAMALLSEMRVSLFSFVLRAGGSMLLGREKGLRCHWTGTLGIGYLITRYCFFCVVFYKTIREGTAIAVVTVADVNINALGLYFLNPLDSERAACILSPAVFFIG